MTSRDARPDQRDPIFRMVIAIMVTGALAVGGFAAFDYWNETGIFGKALGPEKKE